MTAPWWWYPFVKREFGRAMRAPTHAQLKALRELESELARQLSADSSKPDDVTLVHGVLACAVESFLHSRDDESPDDDVDPWKDVRSMWDLFISQAPVWIEAGREEWAYRQKNGRPSCYYG